MNGASPDDASTLGQTLPGEGNRLGLSSAECLGRFSRRLISLWLSLEDNPERSWCTKVRGMGRDWRPSSMQVIGGFSLRCPRPSRLAPSVDMMSLFRLVA
jgi:hypothetical protein